MGSEASRECRAKQGKSRRRVAPQTTLTPPTVLSFVHLREAVVTVVVVAVPDESPLLQLPRGPIVGPPGQLDEVLTVAEG